MGTLIGGKVDRVVLDQLGRQLGVVQHHIELRKDWLRNPYTVHYSRVPFGTLLAIVVNVARKRLVLSVAYRRVESKRERHDTQRSR